MRLLLLTTLFACATTAAADPKPMPPTPPGPPHGPPPPTCKRADPKDTRPVMFELEEHAGPTAGKTTKVYADGAWGFVETLADGKPGKQANGCLTPHDLGTIAATAKLPWKVTTAKIHCMAMAATWTVAIVNDKPVFTEKLCSGQSLDEASAKGLASVHAILDPLGKYELHDGKH